VGVCESPSRAKLMIVVLLPRYSLPKRPSVPVAEQAPAQESNNSRGFNRALGSMTMC
jgi:hypothetical protein